MNIMYNAQINLYFHPKFYADEETATEYILAAYGDAICEIKNIKRYDLWFLFEISLYYEKISLLKNIIYRANTRGYYYIDSPDSILACKALLGDVNHKLPFFDELAFNKYYCLDENGDLKFGENRLVKKWPTIYVGDYSDYTVILIKLSQFSRGNVWRCAVIGAPSELLDKYKAFMLAKLYNNDMPTFFKRLNIALNRCGIRNKKLSEWFGQLEATNIFEYLAGEILK